MTYSFETVNLGNKGLLCLEEVIQFNNNDTAVVYDGQCTFVDSNNEINQMIFDAEQFAAMMRSVELNRFIVR